MSDQRPPYEDVEPPEPTVSISKTRKLPSSPQVIDALNNRVRPVKPEQKSEPVAEPPKAQAWTEARIMRLAAILVATMFTIGFVIAASRAVSIYWAWAPFLVGAVPYFVIYSAAQSAHLRDESASRERRERWEHSKIDVTPITDMGANTERWQ